MKNIHFAALLFLAGYALSCTKEEKRTEPGGRPCLVTRIIDSSMMQHDTTWITYDAQNRPVREEYSNPYTYWKYIYEDNLVIEQNIKTATNEVLYEHKSFLNARGLKEYTVFPGNDTLFASYDAQGRLIGERRKSFDFNYEYQYDVQGNQVLTIYRNYSGTVVKGTISLDYYPDITPNPKANSAGGRGLILPWSGNRSTHAVKKLGNFTYTYELDSDRNIKKTTMTDANNNVRTLRFEYRCS